MFPWVLICPAEYPTAELLWTGSSSKDNPVSSFAFEIFQKGRLVIERGQRKAVKLAKMGESTPNCEFPLQIKHSLDPAIVKLRTLANEVSSGRKLWI